MKKLSLTFLILVILPLCLHAQVFIPTPKHLKYTSEKFSLKNEVRIDNSVLATTQDKQLRAMLSKQKVQISSTSEKSLFFQKVSPKQVNVKYFKTLDLAVPSSFGDEGYLLHVGQDTISFIAETDAGLFYAIQSFNQLLKSVPANTELPGLVLFDKPDIAIRAWQDDISRGPIPTLETLKKEIEIFSSYKLNYFTLYTEQVFKLKKHPKIAPEDGISNEDLVELAAFAEEHFVTLIGNYQSFGHMSRTLILPEYQHLAENKDIISPAIPQTYQFLSEVYEEIIPQYKGKFFNINCDETFGLGEGKSKSMVDSIGLEGVYAYHINRLDKILKKYDKKILMWGDIAVSHPRIIPQLPKDITVIAWAYHDADNFDSFIKPLSDHGLNVWVAPGVSCWSSLYPNLQVAQKNIYNFIRDGYKSKVEGVLNTSWDDDGLNFFNNNWYAFVWGAENCWNVPPNLPTLESDKLLEERLKRFNLAFDLQFFGLDKDKPSMIRLMLDVSQLHQSNLRDALRDYRFFEPILPIFYDYIKKGEHEKNIQVNEQLDALSVRLTALKNQVGLHPLSLDYMEFSIVMAKYITQKNIFRIQLNDFIEGKPMAKNEAEIKTELEKLKQRLLEIREIYAKFWLKENRPYWLAENKMKFEELMQSYNAIEGEVIIIPTDEVNAHGRKIMIRSIFDDYPVYYAINKDTVTAQSSLYKKPFYINQDSRIVATSIKDGQKFPLKKIDLIQHLGVGRFYKLNTTYSNYLPTYDGGGKNGLVDGRLGAKEELKSGLWQGYGGSNIDIELDFKKNINLNSFSMGFFQNTMSWVVFPLKVEIFLKNKATENYVLAATITGTILPEAVGAIKENYKANLGGKKARFMRVVAQNYGNLPEWHPAGSKYQSMIFADEIILK